MSLDKKLADTKITDEQAKEMEENIMKDDFKQYLGIGIHEVEVDSVELFEAKTGSVGIKFNVSNDEGESDVVFWVTQGALPYTIENISRLMVHNAREEKKDDARKMMRNTRSAKELWDIVEATIQARKKQKLPFKGYLSVRYDEKNTYTSKTGEEKPSIVRNLMAYRPKETPSQAKAVAKDVVEKSDKVDLADLPF